MNVKLNLKRKKNRQIISAPNVLQMYLLPLQPNHCKTEEKKCENFWNKKIKAL